MKKTTTLLFAIVMGIITSNAQTYQWAKSMGGTNNDPGYSITVDSFGNVYTTGFFSGTVDFDPGAGTSNLTSVGSSPDIFISKLDAAGNFLWAKSMGGSNNDDCWSIAVDGFGNVYTTGFFSGTADFDPGAGTSNLTSMGGYDIFISKLDTAGNFLWAKSMGGTNNNDVGYSIAVDGSGNVYTTGFFSGTVDFDTGAGTSNLTSKGANDIFISKLDAAGNFLWAKNMGGTNNDFGYSIALDGFGNVYTTGFFNGTADFDPGAETSNLTSVGFKDIYISKLDAAGNFVWARSMGGNNQEEGHSIAVDDSGNVYTTGFFSSVTVDFDPGAGTSNLTSNGANDIFISKLDATGNFIWAKSIGGTSADIGHSITVDGSDNVYITGYFSGTVDFDPGAGTSNVTNAGAIDIFISKLDAAGNFLWAKSIGGTNDDFGHSITLDGSDNVYTTGYFSGTVDFDPEAGTSNLTSAGGVDIFILKLGSASLGILEYSFGNTLTAYPNPTKGDMSIALSTSYDDVTVNIRNLLGQYVLKKSYSGLTLLQLNIPGEAGIYFIEVSSGDKKAILKVMKE
jgi:hypothetical protein